jgi:hypothetical protein
MPGKTIKLYIAGDDLKNLKSAELSNWSGKAFIGERKHIPVIQKIDELSCPGIYFLISQDENSQQKTIYIGEADEVSLRLKNHIVGKEWWDSFVVFISKDSNLTKSHVRYLEKRFYQIAKENTTAFNLQNSSEPPGSRLPKNDIDDLEDFLGYMIFVLQNLGILDFATINKETNIETNNIKEIFYLALTNDRKDSNGNPLKAKLIVTKDGYRLLSGSYIEKVARKSFIKQSYYKLRVKLESEGAFKESSIKDVLVLINDIDFNAASGAAAIVKNRATNGRKEWKLENGMTLDAWEIKDS